jgi:hypothetical protein
MIISHAKGIARVSSVPRLVCVLIQIENQPSLRIRFFVAFAHISLNACLPTQNFLWLPQVDFGHSDMPSLPKVYTFFSHAYNQSLPYGLGSSIGRQLLNFTVLLPQNEQRKLRKYT